MKNRFAASVAMCLILLLGLPVRAQFGGFTNKGLVGVGRIPAGSFDQLGPNVDTLGGVFSSMAFDLSSWRRTGDAANGFTYSGTLYGLPDRGFGDGAQNYLPRIEKFDISVKPFFGAGPVAQNQMTLQNVSALLFSTMSGANFTGFDGNDATVTTHPQSMTGSLGGGRRSIDPEGLVLRASDGGYWVSDEYGPFIYRFDSFGRLQQTIKPPAALIPKPSFTGASAPASGRFNNRGLEGLSLTPDGRRLVAALQSPAVQDGNDNNGSIYTRILVYDVEAGSPNENKLIGEYVYQLTLKGNPSQTRNTPFSELYALSATQFLVLERDGRGGDTGNGSLYKKVNLADVSAATNIAGTGYDLAPGTTGALQLPKTGALPTGLVAATRQDFVDLIDTTQLSRFGLNISNPPDQNTLAEKWEGLALVPLRDTSTPDDYLLLVGNDNDFKAANVFHNGVIVGTNSIQIDSMILAYRVTLPVAGLRRTSEAQHFVGQHYLDFLNRQPDPAGFEFWTNQIADCGADAQCADVKRVNVSAAFFLSIEFQETGYLVYRIHQAAFGTGERLRRQDFLPDTRKVGQNVAVGQGAWEQQLEANTQAFAQEFVSRQAFLDRYPLSLTAAQFVDALSANTGGSLSPSERDDLVNKLGAGTLSRAQVLRSIADDADFRQKEFNRAFVLMEYFGYLGRNPNDSPDTDFAGYDFWLSKLNGFGGDFVRAEMVKAFISSSEYRQRVGLP
ncbi:MAG: esterase-like activity of phytase family protein [Rubrivivax sp.]|nr:esterase-like activity of phytase family protein [Pyrinomonadaceae bacterium]